MKATTQKLKRGDLLIEDNHELRAWLVLMETPEHEVCREVCSYASRSKRLIKFEAVSGYDREFVIK